MQLVITWQTVTGIISVLVFLGGVSTWIGTLMLDRALARFGEKLVEALDRRYVQIGACETRHAHLDARLQLGGS